MLIDSCCTLAQEVNSDVFIVLVLGEKFKRLAFNTAN